MNSLDCQVLGLTMNIVGVVAFANSIVFRRPRQVIEEFFGASRPSLKNIKDHIFRKVHTYFGLGFLLAGFVLQIVAALPVVKHGDAPSSFLPYALLGVVVVGAVGEILATRYSRRSFRRHLRRFFRVNANYPFERNPEIAKEVGEIFDLATTPEETVEGYCRRLRDKVGITEELQKSPMRR
jgi:hypothetical protein